MLYHLLLQIQNTKTCPPDVCDNCIDFQNELYRRSETATQEMEPTGPDHQDDGNVSSAPTDSPEPRDSMDLAMSTDEESDTDTAAMEDVHNKCRLCLRNSKQAHNLFMKGIKPSYAETINDLLGIVVNI